MPDLHFKVMNVMFHVVDFFYPYIKRRVQTFGLREGMTVVDYGCGPGRYTVHFAKLVGDKGKVYALDIHELAIQGVKKRIQKYGLSNIEPILIQGYDSTLPNDTADMVCAIDMFFIIREPTAFLGELKRITKKDGILNIDDGHQPRRVTKEKIIQSGHWDIVNETRDHLTCRKKG